MEYKEIIDKMAVIQARISAALRPISRPYLQASRIQTQRAALVTGPRGVGKTSFLLREAQKQGNALYVSADHPLVSSLSLWELGEKAFLSGLRHLMLMSYASKKRASLMSSGRTNFAPMAGIPTYFQLSELAMRVRRFIADCPLCLSQTA